MAETSVTIKLAPSEHRAIVKQLAIRALQLAEEGDYRNEVAKALDSEQRRERNAEALELRLILEKL